MRHSTRFPDLVAAVALTALLGHATTVAAATPTLSFWASSTSVTAGQSVKLTWMSDNATRCESSGDWPAGRRKLDASISTKELASKSSFTLTCYGNGASATKTVVVNVTQATTTVTPTLKLQASASSVLAGGSVTVSWTGQGVSNCQASGSWSGSRASSGSEVRSQLTKDESFTLSCSSASGTIIAMTSVKVSAGGTQLSWQPPVEKIDGSPLTDLAAYRVYVGTVSRSYYQEIDIKDISKTQYFVNLSPGEYYLAMTAVDAEGNESALSNEVRKVVQ